MGKKKNKNKPGKGWTIVKPNPEPKTEVSVTVSRESEQTKDKRLMGFVFPEGTYKTKTPLDFLIDKETGIGKGRFGGSGPWGIACHDLTGGTNDITIPALAWWEKGRWLTDFEDEWQPLWDSHPQPPFDKRINWDKRVFVVSGEGTPGAYIFRAYLLPKEIAEDNDPKHPLLWGKALREGKGTTFNCEKSPDWTSAPKDPFLSYHVHRQLLEFGEPVAELLPPYPDGYKGVKLREKLGPPPGAKTPAPASNGFSHPPADGGWGYGFKPVSAPPAAPKASPLPAGVRFQHPCGHWFKESELAAHAKVCSHTNGEGVQASWAVSCDKDCGCEYIEGFPTAAHALGVKTLDHVSRCKPGYEPVEKTKEVKMTEGTDDTVTGEEITETDTPTETEAPEEAVPATA